MTQPAPEWNPGPPKHVPVNEVMSWDDVEPLLAHPVIPGPKLTFPDEPTSLRPEDEDRG